ncbi:cell division protein FtsQ [Actinobacillus pleuropneumoniae]|nr:cell division protein FtsQ [Actinobacillus pleuropneumoniae]
MLYGPDTEGKVVLEAWSKIKADLKARNLDLSSVSVDNRGSWTITLSNNVELRLGRGEWTPKIDRFVTIFPEIDVPEGKKLAYVDLRYEHGAAVGFSPLPK